jgi:hypothetical protein
MRKLCLALAVAALAGCGSVATATVSAPRAATVARWQAVMHVNRPLDLAPGRVGGSVILEAAGRLWSVFPPHFITRVPTSYRSPGGEEPYIAVPGAAHGCSFGLNAIYAIRLHDGRGVTRIAPGRVTLFARISAPGLIDGIAFDGTGAFGYRLLVTVNHGATTTVDAIDCHGAVTTITRTAPRVEGGIAVAPITFGRFAGDLIAPDETGGRIFAITPQGKSTLVANSGLPHGNDIGVESETFVPDNRHSEALVADRLTPGNRHPGDDVLLGISYAALRAAGVRPFDLLVATEGGAFTDAVRCGASTCSVHYVAMGPPEAHVEGHIVFIPR